MSHTPARANGPSAVTRVFNLRCLAGLVALGVVGLSTGYVFSQGLQFELSPAANGPGGEKLLVPVVERLITEVPFPFLEENLTSPVELYEYVQVTPTENPQFGTFIGSEELHMSHMDCVGEYRWNKTCLFRNLYHHPKARWLYLASCDHSSTHAEREKLRERLRMDVRVEPNQFLRWEGETRDFPVGGVGRREAASEFAPHPPLCMPAHPRSRWFSLSGSATSLRCRAPLLLPTRAPGATSRSTGPGTRPPSPRS